MACCYLFHSYYYEKSCFGLAHKFDKIPFKLTLKIVVHNKKFQNKLDITLENYGQATGKYIEIIGDYDNEYLLEDKILIF